MSNTELLERLTKFVIDGDEEAAKKAAEEQKKIKYVFIGPGVFEVPTIRGQRQTLSTDPPLS